MIGPPRGRQDAARTAIARIAAALGEREALEVASLQSAAGGRPSLEGCPPFRSPQHTASVAALIGGGGFRPGELSLAHLGVLFLDELPEFPRNALEPCASPSRAAWCCCPAHAAAASSPPGSSCAAMNLCPCGSQANPRGRCRCTPAEIARYRNRVVGPLIDRIDMHVELSALPAEHLLRDHQPPARPRRRSPRGSPRPATPRLGARAN